jgi:hypothetical protein
MIGDVWIYLYNILKDFVVLLVLRMLLVQIPELPHVKDKRQWRINEWEICWKYDKNLILNFSLGGYF